MTHEYAEKVMGVFATPTITSPGIKGPSEPIIIIRLAQKGLSSVASSLLSRPPSQKNSPAVDRLDHKPRSPPARELLPPGQQHLHPAHIRIDSANDRAQLCTAQTALGAPEEAFLPEMNP